MNRDEMIAEIEYACRMIQVSDYAYEAMRGSIGCDPDSVFWSAAFGLQDAIVAQTAKLIGDSGEWLKWFVFENDCGRKGMEAGPANGKLRKIKTAAQLAQLIEATR